MLGLSFAQIIEIMVGILLLLTIGYCAVLNERLKRLRQDEGALKSLVGELINATKVAERSIAALKGTVQEAERSLGDRLDEADRLSGELSRLIDDGRRLAQRQPVMAQPAIAQRPPAGLAPLSVEAQPLRAMAPRQAFSGVGRS